MGGLNDSEAMNKSYHYLSEVIYICDVLSTLIEGAHGGLIPFNPINPVALIVIPGKQWKTMTFTVLKELFKINTFQVLLQFIFIEIQTNFLMQKSKSYH